MEGSASFSSGPGRGRQGACRKAAEPRLARLRPVVRRDFQAFKGDFYAIDPLLFSPAEVIVTAIESGDTFRAGARDAKMLDQSLG